MLHLVRENGVYQLGAACDACGREIRPLGEGLYHVLITATGEPKTGAIFTTHPAPACVDAFYGPVARHTRHSGPLADLIGGSL